MKKSILLSLVLLTVNLICFSNVNTDPLHTFTIQGKFISENNVNYEVYTINSDSTLELVTADCALKFFTIDIEVGREYLIKFVSKDNQEKYLYINAEEYGGFGIDVDFNRAGSAQLGYDHRQREYRIVPLETADIVYVYKKD
jgi:hypothetical protein